MAGGQQHSTPLGAFVPASSLRASSVSSQHEGKSDASGKRETGGRRQTAAERYAGGRSKQAGCTEVIDLLESPGQMLQHSLWLCYMS